MGPAFMGVRYMQKTQTILVVAVVILIGMIFFEYQSRHDLGWWLKGWAILCIVVYIVRLFEKYRGKQRRND